MACTGVAPAVLAFNVAAVNVRLSPSRRLMLVNDEVAGIELVVSVGVQSGQAVGLVAGPAQVDDQGANDWGLVVCSHFVGCDRKLTR